MTGWIQNDDDMTVIMNIIVMLIIDVMSLIVTVIASTSIHSLCGETDIVLLVSNRRLLLVVYILSNLVNYKVNKVDDMPAAQ